MKKRMRILAQCLAFLAVLIVVRIILGNHIPETGASVLIAANYALIFLSGLGCILIYRANTRK